MNYAGRGVVSIDERHRDVEGHHSRVYGAGLVAAAAEGTGHDRRGLGPLELSLHVPVLRQEKACFHHP